MVLRLPSLGRASLVIGLVALSWPFWFVDLPQDISLPVVLMYEIVFVCVVLLPLPIALQTLFALIPLALAIAFEVLIMGGAGGGIMWLPGLAILAVLPKVVADCVIVCLGRPRFIAHDVSLTIAALVMIVCYQAPLYVISHNRDEEKAAGERRQAVLREAERGEYETYEEGKALCLRAARERDPDTQVPDQACLFDVVANIGISAYCGELTQEWSRINCLLKTDPPANLAEHVALCDAASESAQMECFNGLEYGMACEQVPEYCETFAETHASRFQYKDAVDNCYRAFKFRDCTNFVIP